MYWQRRAETAETLLANYQTVVSRLLATQSPAPIILEGVSPELWKRVEQAEADALAFRQALEAQLDPTRPIRDRHMEAHALLEQKHPGAPFLARINDTKALLGAARAWIRQAPHHHDCALQYGGCCSCGKSDVGRKPQ